MSTSVQRKMTRCFMNGKSCIYEREIDDVIESRASSEKKAFVIMPFGEQLDFLYQWEIAPFFRCGGSDPKYQCIPERADDTRQVGFIICEKICKKIQEAHYIVSDLSFNNPNVFYELGLAAALRKEIIPICVDGRQEQRKTFLKGLLGIDDLLRYPRFDMLTGHIKEFIWSLDKYEGFEQMSGDNIVVLCAAGHKIIGSEKYKEEYDFGALCKTAVGTAIDQIFSEENIKRRPELKLYGENTIKKINLNSIDSTSSFDKVVNACKSAACVLIDVSNQDAISNFFWLGYIHGIGGNAIPINSYGESNSSNKENLSPFDIRALWHIAFREDRPIDLLNSLQQILEHIYIRKAKNLNREAFWKNILKDNKVSIFLGSLFLKDLGRNTIGDWDYRTAAEITNYLSSCKETMKVTLKSPIPKWESKPGEPNPGKEYVNWLEDQLRDNSIIIASADVNDLTEVALCKILGHQPPFSRISDEDTKFKGYIAHKKYSNPTDKTFPDTAFYIREQNESDSRGFIIREGGALKEELMEEHAYPGDANVNGVRRLLGQLVVARNPFVTSSNKWIVIISGISGPATLGIAQMLTGCMYEEFTINNMQQEVQEKVNREIQKSISDVMDKVMPEQKTEVARVAYDVLSEYMLNTLLKVAKKGEGNAIGEVNALVSVYVYYPPESQTSYSNDERKVIIWDFPNLSQVMRKDWPNPNKVFCNYSE